MPAPNSIDREQLLAAVPMIVQALRVYQMLDLNGRAVVRAQADRFEDERNSQDERDNAAGALVDTLFPAG